jgi:hypothetical protein
MSDQSLLANVAAAHRAATQESSQAEHDPHDSAAHIFLRMLDAATPALIAGVREAIDAAAAAEKSEPEDERNADPEPAKPAAVQQTETSLGRPPRRPLRGDGD